MSGNDSLKESVFKAGAEVLNASLNVRLQSQDIRVRNKDTGVSYSFLNEHLDAKSASNLADTIKRFSDDYEAEIASKLDGHLRQAFLFYSANAKLLASAVDNELVISKDTL